MILREAIRQVRGFRYMIEQLDICSAVGRRVLYDLPWLDSKLGWRPNLNVFKRSWYFLNNLKMNPGWNV